MKAVTYRQYGAPQVLHLSEVAKPVPADNEVLIKVVATTVNRTGCATIRARPFFMRIMTIKEDKDISMPDNYSYRQAAASSEGAHYAYNFINKVKLERGQNALVNGATGAIGSAAVQLLIKPLLGNKKTIFPMPVDIKTSLLLIKKLIEQDKFKSEVDRKFTLEQTVEAFEYVEKGQKIGNVVVSVAHSSDAD